MSIRTLFVYNSTKLFEILDEIKKFFNFEVLYIDKKNYKTINFNNIENYVFISDQPTKDIKEDLLVIDTPKKISKLIEQINLNLLKTKFNKQSHLNIGKYTLDLNSRSMHFKEKSLNLTEKETNMLLFINSNKKVSLKELQEYVWEYASNLETHTVETHIYRLRKKIFETFNNDNLIGHDKSGYFIVE